LLAPNSLQSLREEWDGLVERCSSATIYQSWDWNEAWWTAFGKGKSLRLLLLRENGLLIGIAPFYVSRHFNSPLRRLALAGTGASDYLDVIAADEHAERAAESILHHLDHSTEYDLADLQQLRPESLLMEAACAARHDTSLRRIPSIIAQEPCPYVPLPGTWDEILKQLGKKTRANIGYYERLFFKSFESAEIRLAGPEELDSAMDSLFDLHQKRWNARLLPGVMGDKKVRTFHHMVAK